MTTVEANAERIFADARLMRDAALTQMAAGDIRDAAEKAWRSTMRAVEALVLVRTGLEPGKSTAASRRLRAPLHERPSAVGPPAQIPGSSGGAPRRVLSTIDYYDPEEIGLLVNQTSDFIQDAERLARG